MKLANDGFTTATDFELSCKKGLSFRDAQRNLLNSLMFMRKEI